MQQNYANTWYVRLGTLALGLALLTAPVGASERMRPLHWTRVDGMSFVSGGVGMHERRELFNLVQHYSALISFASQEHGGFLTNVHVDLSRSPSAGEDAKHVALFSAGPYMFAQLPAGHYELTASMPGWSSERYEFEARPHHHERIFVTLRRRTPSEPQTVSMR